ncbi:MAG: UbiA family prenyltransferase [Bacteroidetes bacterium]|nr:UbiA family prenyltransferase [Bacteroidota bacterium]
MNVLHKEFDSRPLLFVDLDGTLAHTDTLWESVFALLKRSPFTIFVAPLWIIRGKAAFKSEISQRITPDIESLPYSAAIIEYIVSARQAGATVILATAAHRRIAEKVAEHIGIFAEVLATDGRTNLKSTSKAEAVIRRAGNIPFDYIGNASPDIAVWTAAGRAIVANPGKALERDIMQRFDAFILKDKGRRSIKSAVFKEIRPHQWTKNLLIFLPALLAHRFDTNILQLSFTAFLAFCFCASGVYVLNDLLDVTSDRTHPTKKRRPFAAGDLPLWSGALLFPLLFIGSAALSLLLPADFQTILALYAVITTTYSFYLKRLPVLDALTLAALYSMRLYAGAAATSVKISRWLAVFSIFVFVSLAFVKRYVELPKNVSRTGEVQGRGYRADDAAIIASFGVAGGYTSVLVIGLYCYSDEITTLYSSPEVLLIVGALHLFWISRIWLLAHRGEIDDDPITFTLRDTVSYIIGILAILVVLFAL